MSTVTMINPTAYNLAPSTKKVKITFEVAIDMVPGWGDKPEDHVKVMFQSNSYAISAEFEEISK